MRLEFQNGSQFVEEQSFELNGGYSSKYFDVKGHHYLLVGAVRPDDQGVVSRMYRWNGSQFLLHQTFGENYNARDWEVIEVGDKMYMVAMGRYFSNGTYGAGSVIFEFK